MTSYTMRSAKQPYEVQVKSSTIHYRSMGPPNAPRLHGVKAELCKITVGWEPGSMHQNVLLKGFQLLIDGEVAGDVIAAGARQTTIDNLIPGNEIFKRKFFVFSMWSFCFPSQIEEVFDYFQLLAFLLYKKYLQNTMCKTISFSRPHFTNSAAVNSVSRQCV